MQIFSSRSFDRQFKKVSIKIKKQFSKRLELFLNDPWHSQVNLHKLSGSYAELWSINITGDIRAVLDRSRRDSILFIAIGPHSKLYE